MEITMTLLRVTTERFGEDDGIVRIQVAEAVLVVLPHLGQYAGYGEDVAAVPIEHTVGALLDLHAPCSLQMVQ